MSLEESARIVRLKIGDKGLHDAGLAGEVKRAMRVAMARAGADYSNLRILLTAMRQDVLTLEHLVSAVQEAPAVCILKGARDRMGLAVLDLSLICAIVEHVTTAKIAPNLPAPRRPTPTDMALCAGFLDRFLTSLDRELSEVSQAPAISGFRFRDALTDAASIELSLVNDLYQFYRVAVGFDGSERMGEIVLAFQVTNALVGVQTQKPRDWETDWRLQVDHVPVLIQGVMHKVSMPLAMVAALAPGDLIDIPKEQVSRVAVLGANGKQVGLAKLGRQGEHRALRIVQTGHGADKPGLPDDVFRNPDLSQPPINASGSLSPDDGGVPEPVSARQEDI
jgi:flagellar motor switch protein FliM